MRREYRCTAVILAGLMLAVTACGVPNDGAIRIVGTENVPSGAPRTSASSTPSDTPTPAEGVIAEIAFVRGDRLVVQPRRIPFFTPIGQVQALLNELQRGPSSLERSNGLESAVTNAAGLTVTALNATVVTVDISAETPDQSPDRLPLVVGQLVFTVTSVRGVGALRLQRDGTLVDAPLPDGTLTAAPLTRADYQPLTTPAPTPAPSTTR
jgi:hypothetical protein